MGFKSSSKLQLQYIVLIAAKAEASSSESFSPAMIVR